MSMYNHVVPIPDKLEYEPRIPMPEKLQYGDLNDCSARLPVGGIPTQNIAYKLEETPFYSVDNKYESYDDYITSIEDSKNEYLRRTVTDRNCDEPAFNDDTPAYNATKTAVSLMLDIMKVEELQITNLITLKCMLENKLKNCLYIYQKQKNLQQHRRML